MTILDSMGRHSTIPELGKIAAVKKEQHNMLMTSFLAETATLHNLTLPILRARVTMRLLEETTLPAYKGAMLRGGFGYAFQRTSCPRPCWGRSHDCAVGACCPYRGIFETPHPSGVTHLHDLQDVPRPFVIEPPLDQKRQYAAGDVLEFGLVLFGHAIDRVAYFLHSFEQLGHMGLGGRNARAQLERVEALRPWRPTGRVIYQDGRVIPDTDSVITTNGPYCYDGAMIASHAAKLPSDLRITLNTPLRVKVRGAFIETFDLGAIVQSACWRLNTLGIFHGEGPWAVDYRALMDQARGVTLEQARTQWVDWERTSTREPQPRSMKLGGIIGSAVLRGVPPELRALLLAGSLVHVGKACVFGHGKIELQKE
jgi:hypothetical protein